MKPYCEKHSMLRCGCCYKATRNSRTKKVTRHKAKLEIKKEVGYSSNGQDTSLRKK